MTGTLPLKAAQRHPFSHSTSPRAILVFYSHQFFKQGKALTFGSISRAESVQPPVVGILGGIGSGKSSVVRCVAGLQLKIIDADRIGHDLLLDKEIQASLRATFGDEIFSEPNVVNRSKLAEKVFGTTTEHNLARTRLNKIIHPAIRREINQRIASVDEQIDAVILDAALLLEGNWDEKCDWLIFVDTPLAIRQKRVMENRGWSQDELARREATQWSIGQKKDRADFLVDNSGPIEEAAAQMEQIFNSILSQP